MSIHPLNLAVRCVLEMVALVVLAWWGWHVSGVILALLLPLLGAVLWGVFRVPGDSSSSGGAPVAVPGPVRLLLEVALFGAAVAMLAGTGHTRAAWILGAVLVVHYAVSADRVRWLLRGA